MLARGTLQSGDNAVYARKAGESPFKIRFVNTSGSARTLLVYAGPNADTQIDEGILQAGEPAETDLRGVLSVGQNLKVNASGTGVTYGVTEEN